MVEKMNGVLRHFYKRDESTGYSVFGIETDDIDVFGEEFQYLTGEIGKQTFKIARKFMCEHCRKELEGSF